MKAIHRDLSIIIILIAGAWYLHHPWMSDYPSHIHAWAQADRYAIALGFINNGFNFFKPETFIFNHQFPNDWLVVGPSTITSVDFPIHEYFIAIFMKLSGTQSPFVFRLYTLCYSLLGFFFLYKTVYLLSNDYFKSLLFMLFAWLSPLLVYYQSGFLPTIPSLANTFIGLYFYVLYLQEGKNRSFNLAVLFFTIAALNRTTFIIPLLSISGIEFLRVIFKDTKLRPKLLPVALAYGSFLAYMLYNDYLRSIYGSEFLNYILPAESGAEAKELFWNVKNRWKYVYLSWTQYELYAAFIAMGVFSILLRFRNSIRNKSILMLAAIGIISFIGALAFSMAMLRQFPHHDYYFIDAFYFPLIVTALIAIYAIPGSRYAIVKTGWAAMIIIAAFPLFSSAKQMQKQRRIPELWDRNEDFIASFKSATDLLERNNVAKDALVLVPESVAPNFPFIFINRKGYCVMQVDSFSLNKALSWHFDYMLVERAYFASHVYAHYPEMLDSIHAIDRNERLILFSKEKPKRSLSLDEITGFEKHSALFSAMADFEEMPSTQWENIHLDSRISFTGASSAIVDEAMEFGLTYRLPAEVLLNQQLSWFYFSADFLEESSNECDMVLSIHRADSLTYYKRTSLQALCNKLGNWKRITHTYKLPDISPDDKISFCLWNLGRGRYRYDNAEFRIY